jgi:hypothetical protein|tara:strand:- start:202 stop:402 length:201 start_codon:yes stop_codon:yes gene_type:complete
MSLSVETVSFVLSVVFLAGGGWYSLESMGDRVLKVEEKQEEFAKDIRQIMTNQVAVCVAVDADCVR